MLHAIHRPRFDRALRAGRALRGGLATALVALALAVPLSAAAATTETIRITDRLEPAEISVAAGTTVRWVNDSRERHRMRSQSGPARFDSGNLEPGESFSITLVAMGTYRYLDERDDENARYVGSIVVRPGAGGEAASPTPGGDGTPSGGAAGEPQITASVGMADRAFRPPSVTIAPGGSVTWTNDDDRPHTVTSTSSSFDSGTMAEGVTWVQSFPEAGTFAYLCAIHPEMTGEVVVAGGEPVGGVTPDPSQAPGPSPAADPSPAASPASNSAPPPAAGSSAVPAESELVAEVDVRDFDFAPERVSMAAGTLIRFTNRGQAPHTVTADDASFDSGLLGAGSTFEWSFRDPGTFRFLCAFHPEMTGEVVVTAAVGSRDEPAGIAVVASGIGSTAPPPGGADASVAAFGGAGTPFGEATLRLALAIALVGVGVLLFVRTIAGASARPVIRR